jgi:hypothetical protein
MGWKAILRSSIGTSHQQREMLCQDYGNYEIFDQVLVAAIADGAGSAKYADIGAKLAADTAILHLKKLYLRWFKRQKYQKHRFPENLHLDISEHNLEEILGAKIRKIFQKTLKKIIISLEKYAVEAGYSLNDLASTLLVFVATEQWIAAMQIGDGFIVIGVPEKSPEKNYQILFQPDKGEFVNETTFVTSENALNQMQVCFFSGSQSFICAATDGLERVAIITKANWIPYPPFFQPLEKYIQETNNPEEEDTYISAFLNSERLNAKTDDDKTLFLCFFDRPSEARSTESSFLDCLKLAKQKFL